MQLENLDEAVRLRKSETTLGIKIILLGRTGLLVKKDSFS